MSEQPLRMLCLFVCVSVNRMTQKVAQKFCRNFLFGEAGWAISNCSLDFGGDDQNHDVNTGIFKRNFYRYKTDRTVLQSRLITREIIINFLTFFDGLDVSLAKIFGFWCLSGHNPGLGIFNSFLPLRDRVSCIVFFLHRTLIIMTTILGKLCAVLADALSASDILSCFIFSNLKTRRDWMKRCTWDCCCRNCARWLMAYLIAQWEVQ